MKKTLIAVSTIIACANAMAQQTPAEQYTAYVGLKSKEIQAAAATKSAYDYVSINGQYDGKGGVTLVHGRTAGTNTGSALVGQVLGSAEGKVIEGHTYTGDVVAGSEVVINTNTDSAGKTKTTVTTTGGTSLIETGKAAALANQKIAETNSRVNTLDGRVNNLSNQIQSMDRRLSQGIAGSMAIAGMAPMSAGQNFGLGVSAASYNGQSAVAVSAITRITDNMNARLSASSAGGVVGSVTFGF